MSGGGASPAYRNASLVFYQFADSLRCVALVSGGRIRVLVDSWDNQNQRRVVSQVIPGRYGNTNVYPSNPNSWGLLDELGVIYGYLPYSWVSEAGFIKTITVAGKTFEASEILELSANDVYNTFGFVEGQARIITDYGNIACAVKNGTLYPIITEYDQQIEDNKCLTSLYLNGDNEVSGLQDMVDHPGRYLPYDNTTIGEPWSPVENYLHQNVNMPIVPKIGFEPLDEVGIGNALPGVNYEVTL